MVNFTVQRLAPDGPLTLAEQVALWVAGPLGALMGGFLAALMARGERALLHGLASAVLTIVTLVLLEAYWHTLTLAMLVQPASLMVGAATLLAGLGGAALQRN